jgi:polar amino acid transport system substrate-binding protein
MSNKHWLGKAVALAAAAGLMVPLVASQSAAGRGVQAHKVSTRVAAATPASLVPAAIKKRGYLNVAVPDGAPPLANSSPSGPVGMDPQIATELGKLLGLKVRDSVVPFESELIGLQAGKYDIAGGEFYVTAARITAANFISAWHDYSAFLSLKKNAYNPTDSKTLCGKTIGVMGGSAELAALTALNAHCSSKMTLSSFSEENQAFLALSSGRVAAVTTGREQLELASEASPGKFKITGEFGGGPTAWAIARNANTTQLTAALKAAFKEMIANGAYVKILDKWHTEYGAVKATTVYVKGSKLPNYGE